MSARAFSQLLLADGTPYVGELGMLAYDPDEDRVQCHVCGVVSSLERRPLRRTHGWTLAEYRDTFRRMESPARVWASRSQGARGRRKVGRREPDVGDDRPNRSPNGDAVPFRRRIPADSR